MFSDMIKGCYNRELKQRNTLDADSMTQIDKDRFDKATLTQMNRPYDGGFNILNQIVLIIVSIRSG